MFVLFPKLYPMKRRRYHVPLVGITSNDWKHDVAAPFRPAQPASPGLSRSIRSKRVNTFEAIEDLLARCERLQDVAVDSLDEVCSSLGVQLARRFLSERKHLYRRYLAFCLEDKELTEAEHADLAHLQHLLYLGAADVALIHDDVAHEVYGKALDEVLSDLKISAEEEAFLRRLRSELKLSEAEAAVMLEAGRERMRDVALEQASTSDPEFSKPRAPIGQFVGRSDESLEQAVRDAVSKARLAIPRLHWFEVGNISGYVDDEGPKSWHVTVRGGIKTS